MKILSSEKLSTTTADVSSAYWDILVCSMDDGKDKPFKVVSARIEQANVSATRT